MNYSIEKDEQNRNVLKFNPGTDEKVCFFDCVYCPLGRTKTKVSELIPSLGLSGDLKTLEAILKKENIDVVLFDTTGDPLIYRDLDDYVDLVHKCGALFSIESVGYGFTDIAIQKNLKRCDEIYLEIQDTSEKMFKKLHRPADGISYEKLIEGYMNIRQWYKGKLSVKLFFINRYNDTLEDANQLKKIVDAMEPDHLEVGNLNDIEKFKAFHIEEERFETLKQVFK